MLNTKIFGKELFYMSIEEMAAGFRSEKFTAVEVTNEFLARIEAINDQLHAFITVTHDEALRRAQAADDAFAKGIDLGVLQGIPYGLKDIFATKGILTTCNSMILNDFIPEVDCAVEGKLKNAGAVLLGKLNTHEYAFGGPSHDLPFPVARNPWNSSYFTGGSSSGAGVAVAAGLAKFAIGSDTGGSIRMPAAYCGITGLKPTFGLISRSGVFPLSYSLDHCGPMTRTIKDCKVVLDTIAGHDPHDPCSASMISPNEAPPLKIGYARNIFAGDEKVSSELVNTLDKTVSILTGLGYEVLPVEIPEFDLLKSCGRVIMMCEALSVHQENLKKRPQDFGRYTFQRITAATGIHSSVYINAQRVRRELCEAMKLLFSQFDILITATALGGAPLLSDFPIDWPPPAQATATLTLPFNVTGNPVLSMLAGFSSSEIPFGMQIVGRHFQEESVFQVASALETALGLSDIYPEL